MKLRKLYIGAATVGLLVGPVVAAQAADPSALTPIEIEVSTGTGSPHSYTGTLDQCTGAFEATGIIPDPNDPTVEAYHENVEGVLTDTTLDYTSVYDEPVDGMDPYGYTVDADRNAIDDTLWAGTFYDSFDTSAAHPITGTVDVTDSGPFDCTPGPEWTINITTAIGNGHDYTGEINPCDGTFTATGETEADGQTQQETVTGVLTDTTLDYTGEYSGTVAGNPYSYTVDADRDAIDPSLWSGTYTDSFDADPTAEGAAEPINGTVEVVEGDPVNCHEAECLAMDGTPGTPVAGEPETCTTSSSTTTTDPAQTGSDSNFRTTGKGKSQTRHWDEMHGTTVTTTTQEHTWNGDSFEPTGDPETSSEAGDPVKVTCTQNVTGKNKPSPSICTSSDQA